MTNQVDRLISPRGLRRREQLVDAGLALLVEGGWPAVTTRSTAERAGANLGLIHYYLGGLPQLKVAIAERACGLVFGAITTDLLGSGGVKEALDLLRQLLAEPSDSRMSRLTIELIAGAQREPALGDVMRESLAAARAELSGWLSEHLPDAPPGTATLLVAVVDGLLIHRILDLELDVEAVLDAFAAFLAVAPARDRP
ncbi:TetR/AcrR family transcriptional regulator [Streptomyces violascens]|uniref:TetR/AcrR family transcriptional regulator n=1 Tax=Streptomyces violascens TaxID=67381 RepID=UPI0037B7BBFB